MVKMRELGEQTRKSSRISALEQAKEEEAAAIDNIISDKGNNNNNNNNNTNDTATTAGNKDHALVGPIIYQRRRRVPKRKSLDQVAAAPPPPLATASLVVPQQQDLEEEEGGERVNSPISTAGDKPENLPSDHQSWIPEKRILEFILDILQRRDTHELFGHPVDPMEVDGYDEIINEPMDFSTIRAKLQEDMYRTLQEFERDVFLVSRNAMNFNSSATIYFRQARAIHELAKRVFHSVRNNPSEIEREFTVEKSRPGRKPRCEIQTSGGILCNPRPCGRPRKVRRPCRGRASSNSNGCANQQRGCRESRSSVNFFDRRLTYRPWTCLVGEKESIASTSSTVPKQFHLVNEGIGYRESLDRFVKDLGPTAKKVAAGKVVRPVTTLLPQRTPIFRQAALTRDNQLGDRKGKDAITADRDNNNTQSLATCGHPNWTTAPAAAGMMIARLNIGTAASSSNRMPLDIAAAKPTPHDDVIGEPNSAPCRENDDRAEVVRALAGDCHRLTQYTNNNNNKKFILHSLGTGVEGFLGPTMEDASEKYQMDHHLVGSREYQNQLNVAGTINYSTEGRSLIDNAYTNNYLSNRIQPGGLLTLMYRSRKGTKASVQPSVIVKPSSFSQTNSLWPVSGSGSGSSSLASLVQQESLAPPPYMGMEQQQQQQYISNGVTTTPPFPLLSYRGLLEQGEANNMLKEMPLLGRQPEELQLPLAYSYKHMINDRHMRENPHHPNYHVLLGCQTHNQLEPNVYVHQENSWDHQQQQQSPPSDVNQVVQEAQLVGYSYVVKNIANSFGLESFLQQQRIFGAAAANSRGVHAAGPSYSQISLHQAAGTSNNNIAPQLGKYGQHSLMGPDLDLQLVSKPPSPQAL